MWSFITGELRASVVNGSNVRLGLGEARLKTLLNHEGGMYHLSCPEMMMMMMMMQYLHILAQTNCHAVEFSHNFPPKVVRCGSLLLSHCCHVHSPCISWESF